MQSKASKQTGTHNPEEPPLHLIDRNHVSNVHDQVGHEERRQPERGVVVRAEETEGTEEALDSQEREVADQVEGPERASVTVKVGHEVDDDVVDQETNSGEWQVGERVCESDGRRAVETVASLLLQNWTTLYLDGEFTESVETRDEHGNEDDGSTSEGTSSGGFLVEVSRTENDSQSGTESKTRDELEFVLEKKKKKRQWISLAASFEAFTDLELHLELTFSQSQDLTGVTESVRAPLADTLLLVGHDSLPERLLVVLLGLHQMLVVLKLAVEVVSVSGVEECLLKSRGCRWNIVGGPTGGILTLVRVRATCEIVGSALTRKRLEAETLEVGASLRRGTIENLTTIVQNHDLVEKLVDALSGLIPTKNISAMTTTD